MYQMDPHLESGGRDFDKLKHETVPESDSWLYHD